MGRIIILDTGEQSVTAVQDFLEIKADTDQAFCIHRWKVFQRSDATAAEAELLAVNLKRATGSFTSGSGGSSATVVQQNKADAGHSLATIERNNTTQAVVSTGTLETLDPAVWNVIAGELETVYTPELRPVFGPSEAAILSLDSTPGDALTARAIMVIEILAG